MKILVAISSIIAVILLMLIIRAKKIEEESIRKSFEVINFERVYKEGVIVDSTSWPPVVIDTNGFGERARITNEIDRISLGMIKDSIDSEVSFYWRTKGARLSKKNK